MSIDLKELIIRNVDVFKKIEHTPPVLDAIELTLILKAAGFRLESLDFSLPKKDRSASEYLKIDIQCHKSGMVSKLVYKPNPCSCPDEEVALNNSFWEVQASAPNNNNNNFVSSKLNEIHDASSNLLPDISSQAYDFSNTMLQLILTKFKFDAAPDRADAINIVINGSEPAQHAEQNENHFSTSLQSSRESLITNLRDARASIEAGLNLLDQDETLQIGSNALPSLPIRSETKRATLQVNGEGTPRRHSLSSVPGKLNAGSGKMEPPCSSDKPKRQTSTTLKLTPSSSSSSRRSLPAKDSKGPVVTAAASRVAAARKSLVPKPVISKTK